VQDVFALLLRKMPEFEYNGQGFRAWLRTVTLNRWREVCRKARPAVAEGMEQVPDPGEPFWEADHRGHLARRLLALMQSEFAPSTWKACWECVVEGRPAADVGRELGLSPGAVRAAKFRVLCRLRHEMQGLVD
jgi:RNA polymerase sigma-70 factor (ECF subfamily)